MATQDEGLRLTEEEAFALLGLCLTSPEGLDATSERALRKLAGFCSTKASINCTHSSLGSPVLRLQRELDKAGA